MKKEIDEDENIENDKSFHVVWKDRIGLKDAWEKHIFRCGEVFGELNYNNAVEAFLNDIVDIKNGPQLNKLIFDYLENDLEEYKKIQLIKWAEENPQQANNSQLLKRQEHDLDDIIYKKLYHYILQLLEDTGFIFYKSNVEEDELK